MQTGRDVMAAPQFLTNADIFAHNVTAFSFAIKMC